jgi:hypothetical protein
MYMMHPHATTAANNKHIRRHIVPKGAAREEQGGVQHTAHTWAHAAVHGKNDQQDRQTGHDAVLLEWICAYLNDTKGTPMKAILSMIATLALALVVAAPTYAADRSQDGTDENTGKVMVMKHTCPEEIQSEADFDALGGFLQKVLACPVITLEGDEGTGAANAGQANFDFEVMGSDGTMQAIEDAEFMAAKLCETDLNADADGDGNLEADVCVDVSHYMYENVARGDVMVTETMAPAGHHFGSIEFTPDSGDEATLVSFGDGVIELDTSNDDSVMVHVYNFKHGSQMPKTGAEDGLLVSLVVPVVLLAAGLMVRRSVKLAR